MSQKIIYLIRHAQSIGNVQAAQGLETPNDPLGTDLTEEGISQANELVNNLKNVNIVAIYSSPLLRALRTAEILAKGKKRTVQIIENLQERIKGTLGGLTTMQAKKKYQFIYEELNKLTNEEMMNYKLFPDMESAYETAQRLKKVLIEVSRKNSGDIAVVSHGNIIRSFLVVNQFATFKQLPTGSFGNSGYVKLEFDGENFVVLKTYLVNMV